MIANLLSLLRILLLPPLLYSLHRDTGTSSLGTALLLILAASTDLADGFSARRLGQVSRLGKILDPLADKILLGGLSIGLVLWRDFPCWLLVALLGRDTAILLAGLFLLRTRRLVVPANQFGKYTTVCMTLTILAYILPAPPPLPALLAGLSALLILLSSLSYVRLLRCILGEPASLREPIGDGR